MKQLHYFDLVGGSVALLIAVRIAAVVGAGGANWNARIGLVTTAFLLSLAALAAFRSRAYSQKTPWLTGVYAATAMAAVFTWYSSIHVVALAAGLLLSGGMFVVALVLRTRRLSEPVPRHDVFKLSALAIGLLLGLACMEIALRIAPGILHPELRQMVTADPTQFGIAHPYIGYLHRPNSTILLEGRDFKAVHQVDGHGFRNAWPWPQRADIVAVGDSLTFGYGAAASEAWPAIVAAGRPGNPLVNLALVGSGPQQYFRVYETFGVPLHPKLLLVGVFARNDFWDAEMFDRWLNSGAGGNYLVWRDFGMPGPVRFNVRDPIDTLRSLFDHYLSTRLRSSRVYNLVRALRGSAASGISAAATTVRFNDGHQIVLSSEDFLAKSELGAKTSRSFSLALGAFERIQAMTAANGTHVLMVLQPSKEETYLPQLQGKVPDPSAALRDAFDQRGIEYLDLAPAFRERAAAGERLFFETDGHPNAAGYALTGRVVLAHLQAHADQYGLNLPADLPAGNPRAAAAAH